jgi:3-dehydroquinate synthase
MSATSSPPEKRLSLRLGERSYAIDIAAGNLANGLPAELILRATKFALISNDVVFPLYGEIVRAQLASSGKPVITVVVPDGESNKNWQTLNVIFDALLENACDRKTLLVALGGGVVGDMVGFAAATYQRGVPFVQIPTTLLAQVDSSVGGKTAINHPLGKNMVGAFYQPKHVLIDTEVLRTLPDREFRAGLAEVIKYGIALDAPFFGWLERNIELLIQRDAAALAYAIRRSCEIKAEVVAGDEFELEKDGGRALLNFGHTFGHAIETALGYGAWLHGEAVGCGMALATRFSLAAQRITAEDAERILQLIARTGLATTMPDSSALAASIMIAHMSRDKKNEAGAIKLILLTKIGGSEIEATISREKLLAFFQN